MNPLTKRSDTNIDISNEIPGQNANYSETLWLHSLPRHTYYQSRECA